MEHYGNHGNSCGVYGCGLTVWFVVVVVGGGGGYREPASHH